MDELGRRFGTPLYVYSRSAMQAALAGYQRALAGRPHLVCYAMKANSSLAVLQLFAQAGCGFDIVSGGELERVLRAGGVPAKIIFSGVGSSRNQDQLFIHVQGHNSFTAATMNFRVGFETWAIDNCVFCDEPLQFFTAWAAQHVADE